MLIAQNDESQLLSRVRAGSKAAAGELFALHWVGAWKVAHAVCRDHALAEDIAQESLIRALQTVDRFDGQKPFGAYVRRIVVNRALNAIRSRKRDAPIGDAEAMGGDGVMRLPDRRLATAVDGLPTNRRVVILLRFGADLTVAEIAAALGLPEGTVSSRLARALAELRRVLEVHDDERS